LKVKAPEIERQDFSRLIVNETVIVATPINPVVAVPTITVTRGLFPVNVNVGEVLTVICERFRVLCVLP
jgi:hypothetical protein